MENYWAQLTVVMKKITLVQKKIKELEKIKLPAIACFLLNLLKQK